MNLTITFDECEHFGDMEAYQDDMIKSGATINEAEVNTEAETGHVSIWVNDLPTFISLFRDTESFDFCNLA